MSIFDFKRKKDKIYSEQVEEEITQQDDQGEGSDPNTEIERKLGAVIGQNIMSAEQSKRDTKEQTGWSIEDHWEDEYKLLRGGGLQWTTNMARRSIEDRKHRPNSEDNFIHNAIDIQTSNLTSTPIEPTMKGRRGHEDKAEKLTHISRFNDKQNKFKSMYKEIAKDFISFGPAIIKVCWDGEWIGGAGPDRFIGEVKLEHIAKEDFLVDPAIMDLDRDLQECAYIGFKSRQKVRYVVERWERFAKHISADVNDDPLISEGNHGDVVTLYEMYHKEFPEYMPEERKQELRERAMMAEEKGDHFKAEELFEMAEGNVKGVHLAYYADDILLEYIPYVYDNGKYPVVYKTRYRDHKCQWGYGEIRNIKIPQIIHNKADEIELSAMALEGLGGGYFEQGSVDKRQLDNIIQNNAKNGMWFAVNRLDGIRERTGAKVPANIPAYKEHKQKIVETVSSNTPIQQGMSVGASTPYSTVAELGQRTDVRVKFAADKLKDLLIEVNKLRIDLFAQFYTQERYYRYTDSQDEVHEGSFVNDELFDVWQRDTREVEQVDPMTGEPMMVEQPMQEYFIPEFDIDITIVPKKPNDRAYHTDIAFKLFELQILSPEGLMYTLEEGVIPDKEEVLEELKVRNHVEQMIAQVQQLPEQTQGMAMQNMGKVLQATVEGAMQATQQQGQQEQQY